MASIAQVESLLDCQFDGRRAVETRGFGTAQAATTQATLAEPLATTSPVSLGGHVWMNLRRSSLT